MQYLLLLANAPDAWDGTAEDDAWATGWPTPVR